MNYISVCSGIEAATVAWHPLGWTPVAFAEIEKFPSALLAHYYPSVPNWGDMTKFKEWPDANIDVLVGGTPCQSFSVAGFRKGLADPRGNLALTYLALADKYRPEWLVWENVPGVLSSGGGRDFGAFLGGLAELGYGWAYRVLDAAGFGVPQSRRRVFVVGYLGDWHRAAAVLFERECLQMDPSQNEAREVFPCLYAGMGHKWGSNQWLRSGFCVLDKGWPRRVTPLEAERLLGFPDGYTAIPYPQRNTRSKASGEPKTPLRSDRGAISGDVGHATKPMRPLRRRDEAASRGSRPSDRSGARDSVSSLQHQAPSGRGHGVGDAGVGLSGGRRVTTDGPRYKALGNSMAVPVMRWIGKRIQMVAQISEI